MQGTGRELKVVLDFLRENYPEPRIIGQVIKNVKMDEVKVVRLIAYAFDKGWVTITDKHQDVRVGPYKLTSYGIDKLNSWTDEDDELSI